MTDTRTPALDIDGLGLTIGGATILEHVNLRVERGSLVGVIGPNGAGKTTLFNAISGIVRPTAGHVRLDGADITAMSVIGRARAGLGRTFQTSNLFGALSVRENVRLAAQGTRGASSLLRFPRRTDQASVRADECLDLVGLAARGTTPAAELAHGDKRKLEIAMLIASGAETLLLDEPMAGVASGDVSGLVENIRDLHRETDRTILIVEHHIDVLMELVDVVAVMYFGSIIAFDRPERVMADPTVQRAYLGSAA